MASRQAIGAGKGPALAFTMLRAKPMKASWLGYLIRMSLMRLTGNCFVNDLGRERLRGGQQVVGHNAIEQRRLCEIGGADRLAADNHVDCNFEPDGPRQALRAAGPRYQSDLHFRQADARRLGAPRGTGIPARARSRRPGRCPEMAAMVGLVLRSKRRIMVSSEGSAERLRRVEFLYIGAAGKEFVRADQDHGRDGRILLRLRQLLDEVLANGMRQRIDRRIVELDDGHCVGRAGR